MEIKMDEKSKNRSDFTTGSIPKMLFSFSIPFFLTNLIQAFYNIADIMVLGKFCGKEGIAGASIGGNVTFTVTYMIIGLCNGGAIMTAQYAGAKNEKDMKETISSTFGLMLFFAVLSTVLSFLFTGSILEVLNTPTEAFEKTAEYFRICMLGSIFIFGYNSVCAILRGLGNSKVPMYFGIFSCVLNILLDLLLVGGFRLDVKGAAFATVISQTVALIGCIVYLKHENFPFDFKPKSFRINREKALNILKLGLPGCIQNMIVSGGFLMVSSITNSIGLNAASGVAVAQKVNNFAQMPATAVGMAVSSMVGQNVGAEKYDRARSTMKWAMLMSMAVGIVMFLIVQSNPIGIMRLLVDEEDVLITAEPYLRITACDYLLVALIFPLNGLCNGSGHTLFTMLPSIFSSVIVRVPAAMICTKVWDLGLLGVGIATPVGTVSAIIICGVYYLSNRWCKKVIV